MAEANYRPATLCELLRWAKDNWNGNDWIIALGQIWLDADGNRYVAVLDLDDGWRKLNSRWFDYDWNDRHSLSRRVQIIILGLGNLIFLVPLFLIFWYN